MDNIADKPFKCTLCPISFKSKSGANRHYRTSHGNKFKYECNLCEYKASRSDTLKKHVDTHQSANTELLGLLEVHQQEQEPACAQMETDPGANSEVRVTNNLHAAIPLNTEQISTINWPEINALLAGQNANLNISSINSLISTPHGTSQPAQDNNLLSLQTTSVADASSLTSSDVVTSLPTPPVHLLPIPSSLPQTTPQVVTQDNHLTETPVSILVTSTPVTLDTTVSDTGVTSTPTPESLVKALAMMDDSSDNDDDDEQLVDGIIDASQIQHHIQPTPHTKIPFLAGKNTTVSSPITNFAVQPQGQEDLIKLKTPGVQLTVFRYNILPTVGNIYEVTKDYHLQNVKYPPGVLYQSNHDGNLERVQYLPFQVYQADHLGILMPLGIIGTPTTSTKTT